MVMICVHTTEDRLVELEPTLPCLLKFLYVMYVIMCKVILI
jgi:hypothetical protein